MMEDRAFMSEWLDLWNALISFMGKGKVFDG